MFDTSFKPFLNQLGVLNNIQRNALAIIFLKNLVINSLRVLITH